MSHINIGRESRHLPRMARLVRGAVAWVSLSLASSLSVAQDDRPETSRTLYAWQPSQLKLVHGTEESAPQPSANACVRRPGSFWPEFCFRRPSSVSDLLMYPPLGTKTCEGVPEDLPNLLVWKRPPNAQGWCHGTVIEKRQVLTAAHCVTTDEETYKLELASDKITLECTTPGKYRPWVLADCKDADCPSKHDAALCTANADLPGFNGSVELLTTPPSGPITAYAYQRRHSAVEAHLCQYTVPSADGVQAHWPPSPMHDSVGKHFLVTGSNNKAPPITEGDSGTAWYHRKPDGTRAIVAVHAGDINFQVRAVPLSESLLKDLGYP